MKRLTKCQLKVISGLLLAVCAMHAQSPEFEVATIRSSAPIDPAALRSGTAHLGIKIDGARVDIGTTPLLELICIAYQLKPWQVSGPGWLKSTNFDIQASIPQSGAPEKVPRMLQALLTERFGLKVHRENKEQSAYALVVVKGGPRLTVSASGSSRETSTSEAAARADAVSVPTIQGEVKMTRSGQGITLEMPAGEINAKVRVSFNTGTPPSFHMESAHITLKIFADLLNVGALDRPVVDMTNLADFYDVAVDMSAIEALNLARNSTSFLASGGGGDGDSRKGQNAEASEPAGASILSSIEKMGLRLDSRKLPLTTLVVDHIEKIPVAN
jgi:uncharacterized protein (TIGR03435 family)